MAFGRRDDTGRTVSGNFFSTERSQRWLPAKISELPRGEPAPCRIFGSTSALGDFQLCRGDDSNGTLCPGPYRKATLRRFPAVMCDLSPVRRVPPNIAHQAKSPRVEIRGQNVLCPLGYVDHRTNRKNAFQYGRAIPMNIPHRRTDLRIAIRLEIFLDEIHKPCLPLERFQQN